MDACVAPRLRGISFLQLQPDPELYTSQSIRETFTLVRTELNSVFNVVVETDRGLDGEGLVLRR